MLDQAQCTAWKSFNVTHKMWKFSKEHLVFCQLYIGFINFEVYSDSIKVHKNVQLNHMSYQVYTYFLPTCPFWAKIFIIGTVILMSGNCCISPTVCLGFLGEVLGFVSITWSSPVSNFSLRKTFLLTLLLQLILAQIEKENVQCKKLQTFFMRLCQ